MKIRLKKIEISNFKAFRSFELDLEGRHLLVYGANGAGKSSLYWALYTFLQSSRKPKNSISKYFDGNNSQNLLNIHEEKLLLPEPGCIAFTFRDTTTNCDAIFRISKVLHETHDEPTISNGDTASDFVTYRFFFGFSDFKNSAEFNIWPLFKKEILPFCEVVGHPSGGLEDRWNRLEKEDPNPLKQKGRAGKNAYDNYNRKLKNFSIYLKPLLEDINKSAQEFYDTNFAADDLTKITLKLAITRDAYYSKEFKLTIPPALQFGVQADGAEIKKPQSFMNEAKMTQLALSIRFGASLLKLRQADLKLLVLDDLLVSLDMSNRMKVVEIILSESFAIYQKIILTHDMGFFREFRRALGSNHSDWECVRLEGKSSDPKINCVSEKSDTQKAEDYLHGHRLDEAALFLRKACEDTAKRFNAQNEVLPTNKFIGLAEALREARNKVAEALPKGLYGRVFRDIPPSHASFIVPSIEEDIDQLPNLSAPEKGKLKTARKRLREIITPEHAERFRQIKLIDDILDCTERVLNPAAHSGSPPLYKKEVEDALALVRQLESTLQT